MGHFHGLIRLWMGQRNPNHQLIAGKHPILYRVSSICLVVQDFATIHSYQHRGVRDNPRNARNGYCDGGLSLFSPWRLPEIHLKFFGLFPNFWSFNPFMKVNSSIYEGKDCSFLQTR
jgi:hypothetical protein